MDSQLIVSGVFSDAQTIRLDQPTSLLGQRVRLVIDASPRSNARPVTFSETIRLIRAAQNSRSFVPPSEEEVLKGIAAERESWGDDE